MARRPLSRRTTLGAALAVPLAVGACDIDPLADEPHDRDRPDESTATVGADLGLITAVLQQIDATMSVVASVAAHPATADLARRLTSLHEAQADVLGRAHPADVASSTPDAPDPAARPRRRVLTSERQLERLLVRSAVDADSGDLARVLASAAAAIAQELAAPTATLGGQS